MHTKSVSFCIVRISIYAGGLSNQLVMASWRQPIARWLSFIGGGNEPDLMRAYTDERDNFVSEITSGRRIICIFVSPETICV